eukprot:TRINITY_DN8383_c0_g1_i2.p1 TRINITY_DN8383_c0_g1~~TRINITY_DN8383_c0_g1_i2.p1  ORF type:complete len:335 (+),score=57.02 TRINITY_DN8383_c0_g1_i2:211-1215(+)
MLRSKPLGVLPSVLLALFLDVAVDAKGHFFPHLGELPGPVWPCNCTDQRLCDPLDIPPRKEVFAFHTGNSGSVWHKFDYSLVTTIAVDGPLDPALVCFAHSKRVRVTLVTTFYNESLLPNPDARKAWTEAQLQFVAYSGADGINIDIEGDVRYRGNLSLLVEETAAAFRNRWPSSQLSFDTSIHPDSETAFYDFPALADALDFLVPMAYDMDWAPPVAGPNSPMPAIQAGLTQYTDDQQISADKIVLALPWYGFTYPCEAGTADNARFCNVTQPFGSGSWTVRPTATHAAGQCDPPTPASRTDLASTDLLALLEHMGRLGVAGVAGFSRAPPLL